MKSYGIDFQGNIKIEEVATLPEWAAGDERRVIYVADSKKTYYATNAAWLPFESGGSGKELTPASASDHNYDGLWATMTVGENVVFGNCLYYKSDGKLWLSDADAIATMPIMAMAMASISADASGVVLLQGFVRDDSWNFTVGGLVYGSTTSGGLTQAAPDGSGDVVGIIGIATHADRMHFNPQLVVIEIA